VVVESWLISAVDGSKVVETTRIYISIDMVYLMQMSFDQPVILQIFVRLACTEYNLHALHTSFVAQSVTYLNAFQSFEYVNW
jgi:hypothetical protein